ncbi:MAG: hypothetical protein IT287_05960 [Bdellovibrionaceae bacterium]|nr:hypothetical protein [Pseudobdellovibrionaceae bacterium]
MMRLWLWALAAPFILSVVSCTAEQPNATAKSEPCDFKVAEHTTPKFATYANELSIPYDQEKLVQFMWVDLNQSECFAKQYAPVKIYRVPFPQDNGVFSTLPEAPKDVIKTWTSFEQSSGNALKGLTTFTFESGKNEKIVKSFMLVRADASSWHLWHEFSHFIIGTKRADHHDQNLMIAEQKFLDKAKNDILEFNSNESVYSKKLQTFFNSNYEFITKRFIDEIIIEATLVHLTHQSGATPEITSLDIQSAVNMIQFFAFQMNFQIVETINTIGMLRDHPLTKAQTDLLDMYEDRLNFQRQTINKVLNETVQLTGSSLVIF